MSESLKDQLIRAGLAPARPGKQKKSPVHKTETDPATAYRHRKNEAQQRKRDNQRQKLADEKRRQKVNKELRSLVEAHSVSDPEADIARNFVFKGRIRKILVNKDQLAAVNSGELVIVYLAGSYHLVPAEIAANVQQIAPGHLPDLGAENSPEDEDFPVPDDLVW